MIKLAMISCRHWGPNYAPAFQSLPGSSVTVLDYGLVELVGRRLGTLKTHGPTPNPLIVNAIAGLLPLEVVHRSKMGFILPLSMWLRGQVASQLDSADVATVWRRFLDGRAEWVRHWPLYILKAWGRALLPVSATAPLKLTP